MKFRNNHRPHSLTGRLTAWMVLLLLPLLILVLVLGTFINHSFEIQMKRNIEQMLSPFTAEIDAALSSARRYIANQNFSLRNMDAAKSVSAQLNHIKGVRQLGNQISQDLSSYPDIDAVFLYRNEDLWFINNYDSSYALNYTASESLKDILKENSYGNLFAEGYLSFTSGNQAWLYTAIHTADGIIGCWFSEKTLLSSLTETKVSGFIHAALVDAEGNAVNAAALSDQAPSLTGKEIIVTSLKQAPYSIRAYWDRSVILAPMHAMLRTVALGLSIVYLLYIGYMIGVGKTVIRPLKRMTERLHHMKADAPDALDLDRADPSEIQEVLFALNTQIEEIRDLKIQIYEEQLSRQDLQLQLYQQQLNPHFLMNLLNNIVSSARSDNYALVQKFALFLAAHCRYILYSSHFVTLEEELDYTQKYVQIRTDQGSSYPVITFSADAPEELLDCMVPILCVQIFVENSTKYAQPASGELRIVVRAEYAPDKENKKLHLAIADNGKGFSPEILTALSSDEVINYQEEKHGIGILNIRQRLQLLYKGQASLSFSNCPEGGAYIDMILPIQ